MNKPRRGKVVVTFDDAEGVEYIVQGAIKIREVITTSGIDFTDGTHKEFPLHTADIAVIIKDEAFDLIGEG